MSAALTLIANRFRMTGMAVRRSSWAQRVVAGIFLAIGAALMVGVYFLFRRGFSFLLADEVSGPLVLRYVLDVTFALTYFLGISSVIVTSNSLLFGSEDLKMLMSKPLAPVSLFTYRFASATAASAWPVLLIAAPALAALGTTFGASIGFILAGLASMLLFVFSVTVFGGIISFFLAWASRPISLALRKFLEVVAFFGFGIMLVRRIIPRGIFRAFEVSTTNDASATAEMIRNLFAPLPSHPFAAVVSSLVPFGTGESLVGTLAFTLVTLVAGSALLFLIASRAYVPLWQRYGEVSFTASVTDRPYPIGSRKPFPRFFRMGHSFLFEKDLLMFTRDGAALSRGGFLLLLLGLYLLIVRAVTRAFEGGAHEFLGYAVTFAFAAIGYFTLTLTLRFVFPSLSLEGRGAWLEWSSPIHTHEIFSWKGFFWSSLFVVAMEIAAVAVIWLFSLPALLAFGFAYATFLSVITLVTLGMAAGTAAPNFRAKDADEVATSAGGLATAVGGGLYLWIMTRYVHELVEAAAAGQPLEVMPLVGMTVVSVSIIAASWALALRFVDRLEVT